MKTSIFITAFTCFVLSLTAQEKKLYDHYQSDTFDVTIFSNVYTGGNGFCQGRFSPTRSEVDSAEKKLRIYYKDVGRDSNMGYNRGALNTYKRQYIGFRDTAGDKYLWINCFPESLSDTLEGYKKGDWIKDLIEGFDDPGYWTIKYSIPRKELYDHIYGGSFR